MLRNLRATDVSTIEKVVARYKSIDAWCDNPLLTEESLNSLVEIMKEAGELDKAPGYNDIVITDFANKAIENNK